MKYSFKVCLIRGPIACRDGSAREWAEDNTRSAGRAPSQSVRRRGGETLPGGKRLHQGGNHTHPPSVYAPPGFSYVKISEFSMPPAGRPCTLIEELVKAVRPVLPDGLASRELVRGAIHHALP